MLRGVRIPTTVPPAGGPTQSPLEWDRGGEHTYSSWIVRSGRPVPSGRTLAREGVVRPGDPFLLVRAARPQHPHKGKEVMEEMCKVQAAVGAGSKIAPRDPFSSGFGP